MNNKALDLNQSINWLKAGKVLVHPTESIWGLGCDALNESAINLIFKLKKRPLNKSLIVLAESYFSIKELCNLERYSADSLSETLFLSKNAEYPNSKIITNKSHRVA